MASFFKSPAQNQDINERTLLENKYHAARHNLLIVIAFTVLNSVLLAAGGDSYFLFSAYVPYFMVGLGMEMCGMFPAEYYEAYYTNFQPVDKTAFVILLVIAIVLLSVYLLCWILSKKNRVGWLIFALVWFGIDSIMLLVMMGADIVDYIMDVVFHAWVIISLINGIRSYYKLQKLPEESEQWPVPEQTAGESIEYMESADKTEE